MRRGVRLPVAILAATLATGCATRPGAGPPADPWAQEALEGSYEGVGANRLRFDGRRWSVDSDQIRYEGTYRVDGRRLVLHTERVLPPAYGDLCRGADDEYSWALVEDALTLRPTGEVCSQNLRSVLLGDWSKH